MLLRLIKRGMMIGLLLGLSLSSALPGIAQDNGDDDADENTVHIVTDVESPASVRRDGWTGFSALDLGASVKFGDLIDPGEQGVKILCADLTEQTVTQLGPIPCPKARAVLHQETVAFAGWQRAIHEDLTIPFLIGPRATQILTPRPMIRWNPIREIDGYRIIVRGEGLNWSTDIDDIRANALRYPDDAPALEADVPYTVEVIGLSFGAEGRTSAEEDAPNMSFTLATAEDVETYQALADEIRSAVSNEAVEDFVIARLYFQNGLYAEALDLLWAITGDVLDPETRPDTPMSDHWVVYQLLGDVFLQTNLELYATAAYANALELAAAAEDAEGQALASLGLAQVIADDDRQDEFLRDAAAFFAEVGASEMLSQLESEFGVTP